MLLHTWQGSPPTPHACAEEVAQLLSGWQHPNRQLFMSQRVNTQRPTSHA